MSGSTRVQLVFDSSRIDIEAALVERRGGLRLIAREAEQKWGLTSNNYSFYDSFGKVDTPAALQRAAGAARGVCQLEVRENSEGKIKREMHAAMKNLEERMMKKMDDTMACLRGDIEPAIKIVADEQSRSKAKIDGILDDMLAMRSDSVLVEEELNKRIDSLAQDCFDMRVDTIAGEEELTARLDALTNVSLRQDLENLEQQLQAELETQASRDFDLDAASENIDQILADVRSMGKMKDCSLTSDDDEVEVVRRTISKKQANESAKETHSTFAMPWDRIVKGNDHAISFNGQMCMIGGLKPEQQQRQQQLWDGLRPSFEACRAPFAQGGGEGQGEEAASLKKVSRFHVEGLRGLRPSRSTPMLAPLK
jgi:hypothetical protein